MRFRVNMPQPAWYRSTTFSLPAGFANSNGYLGLGQAGANRLARFVPIDASRKEVREITSSAKGMRRLMSPQRDLNRRVWR
jgi:hypothetical protein